MKYKNRLIVPTLVSTGLLASTIAVSAEEVEQNEQYSEENVQEYSINGEASDTELDFVEQDETSDDEEEPPEDDEEEDGSTEEESEEDSEDDTETEEEQDEESEETEEDAEEDAEEDEPAAEEESEVEEASDQGDVETEESDEEETSAEEDVEEESVVEEAAVQEESDSEEEAVSEEGSVIDEEEEGASEEETTTEESEEPVEEPATEETPVTDEEEQDVAAEDTDSENDSEEAAEEETDESNENSSETAEDADETPVEEEAEAEENVENAEEETGSETEASDDVEENLSEEEIEENQPEAADETETEEQSTYQYDSESLQQELENLSEEERAAFIEENADDIEADEELINDLSNTLAANNPELDADEIFSATTASTFSTMSVSQAIDDINEYIAVNDFEVAPIQYDILEHLPEYAYHSDYGWEPENGEVGKPEGVVLHDVGNDDSTIHGEISYMSRNWENAFVHAFVDANNIIQIADTDYLAYGAGPNSNQLHMHVELVRHHNAHDFAKSINNYADYIANLLYKYKLPVDSAEADGEGTLWSHVAVSEHLGGTNSPDPYEYFGRFGYEYNDVIELIGERYDDMYHKRTTPQISMPIDQGSTNVLAEVSENNSGLYESVTDVKTADASHLLNDTFHVTRTATYNYDDYYLLEEDDVVLGWMRAGDLTTSEYVSEPEEEENIEEPTPEEPETPQEPDQSEEDSESEDNSGDDNTPDEPDEDDSVNEPEDDTSDETENDEDQNEDSPSESEEDSDSENQDDEDNHNDDLNPDFQNFLQITDVETGNIITQINFTGETFDNRLNDLLENINNQNNVDYRVEDEQLTSQSTQSTTINGVTRSQTTREYSIFVKNHSDNQMDFDTQPFLPEYTLYDDTDESRALRRIDILTTDGIELYSNQYISSQTIDSIIRQSMDNINPELYYYDSVDVDSGWTATFVNGYSYVGDSYDIEVLVDYRENESDDSNNTGTDEPEDESTEESDDDQNDAGNDSDEEDAPEEPAGEEDSEDDSTEESDGTEDDSVNEPEDDTSGDTENDEDQNEESPEEPEEDNDSGNDSDDDSNNDPDDGQDNSGNETDEDDTSDESADGDDSEGDSEDESNSTENDESENQTGDDSNEETGNGQDDSGNDSDEEENVDDNDDQEESEEAPEEDSNGELEDTEDDSDDDSQETDNDTENEPDADETSDEASDEDDQTSEDDNETDEEVYSSLEDSETGVRIISETDELEDKSMVVTVMNPSDAISAEHDLYDIHILNADGSLYSLDNPVTVYLPADGYVSNVYYLGDIGETLEAVNFTTEDGYAVFEVDDFSQYAVVYGNEGEDNTTVTPVSSNKEPADVEKSADKANEHPAVYTEKEAESDDEADAASTDSDADHDGTDKAEETESEVLPDTGVAEQSTTLFAAILAALGLGFLVKRRKPTDK